MRTWGISRSTPPTTRGSADDAITEKRHEFGEQGRQVDTVTRAARQIALALVAGIAGVAFSGAVTLAQKPVEPRADAILRAMGEYLGAAEEFTFEAAIAYDTLSGTGQAVQYGGRAEIAVRRPDRLRVEFDGDERRSSVVYDGETVTFYNAGKHLYATTESDTGIDDAVDRLFEVSGFSVPLADLLYSDPYAVLTESVEAGFVVGRSAVDGVYCHHLAFSQQALDWQIWIEDGPRPVPRRLVITYKNEPDVPQYVARISRWDFQPGVADGFFVFEPPAEASQIEFMSVPRVEVEP